MEGFLKNHPKRVSVQLRLKEKHLSQKGLVKKRIVDTKAESSEPEESELGKGISMHNCSEEKLQPENWRNTLTNSDLV